MAYAALSAALSGVAAVYTEWVLKRSSSSLHWQNMQLYSWGVVVNAAGLACADVRGGLPPRAWMRSLLQGYNAWAYGATLNLALSGLLVAWIMLRADMGSLLKVATECASWHLLARAVFVFLPMLCAHTGDRPPTCCCQDLQTLLCRYLPPAVRCC